MSVNGTTVKPYMGLVPYSERDALFFFGREKERRVITDNLLARRLTLVLGESGVGKSSLLSAGVSADLRWLARENLDATGKPGHAALVFRGWKGDPVAGLKQGVEEAVKDSFFGLPVEPVSQSLPLAETLGLWADRVGGALLIILDQFEEYFMYNGQESGDGTFAAEFPRLMKSRYAKVSFLISIRSDAYEKLERFKDDIPNIYNNSLHIKHLDRDAASEAIQKPVEKYNHLFAAGRQHISIEPGLVEIILNQLKELEGRNGLNRGEADGANTRIKAPFLQLVMMRLWKEEMSSNSTTLRLETLKRLENTEGIVGRHLDSAMKDLTPEERVIARQAFSHLVSPSETKYAYSVPDLVRHIKVEDKRLENVLEKLSGFDTRILRAVEPQKSGGDTRYEVFHDVLAKPILEYVQEAEKAEAATQAAEQERARIKALWIKGAKVAAILLLILLALLFAMNQIRNANEAKKSAEDAALRELEKRIASEESLLRRASILNETLYTPDDPQGSKARFEEVVSFYQQKGDRESEGIARMGLGEFYYRQRYYDEAEKEYLKAKEVLETALHPGHAYLALVVNKLALAYYGHGKYSEIEPLYKQAIENLESNIRPSTYEVATSLRGLGEFYQQLARYDEAEQAFNQAREIDEKLFKPNHQQVAIDLTHLAGLKFKLKRYDEAEQLFNQALAILGSVLEPGHMTLVSVSGNLAAVYSANGKYAAAEPLLLQALGIQGREYGRTDPRFAEVETNLGSCFNEQGKYADALPLHTETLFTREIFYGKEHPEVAVSLNNLGYTYSKLGDCDKAIPVFLRALDIRKQFFDPAHPDIANSLNCLAECYRDKGRYAEAETLFKQALDIREKKLGLSEPDVAVTLESRALLYIRQAKYSEAENLLRRSLSIRESALRAGHPKIAETLEDLALLLRATNRNSEAADAEQRAREIRENK